MSGTRTIRVKDTVYEVYYDGDCLIFDGMTVSVSGRQITITGSGGGVTVHSALTSLAWTASGHTGTPNRIAGFGGGGGAAYYQIGVDLQAYDAGLTSLTAADGSAGLPYVTGADTWATATLGDLAVSGGAWQVATVGGSSAATVAGQRAAHEAAYDHGDLPTSGQKNALAGSYGTPGSANTYVTTTDPRLTGTAGPSGGAAAIAAYGQARDGDVDFDGASSVTGWSRSGTTYTYTGTRDPHYGTVTVATGVTLKTEGALPRCRTLAAGDNVTFAAIGTAAVANAAGLGALPAAISTSIAGATFYGGEDGAAGRTANAAGLSAPSLSAGALRGGGLGGNSGRVRLTSLSAIGSAGAQGAGTEATTKPWYSGDVFSFLLSGFPFFRNGTAIAQVAGGTGGGGGPLSTAGASGGGGGGGGVLGWAAATASFGTGCVFTVDGMAGGNAAVTGGTNSVGAGGGGGGGGLGCCVIGEITGSNVPTFYARGGAGGNASLDGTGYWAEGGNGGSGGYWFVYFGTTPATPTITVTGGAGGTNQGSGTGFTGSVAGSNGTAFYGTGS